MKRNLVLCDENEDFDHFGFVFVETLGKRRDIILNERRRSNDPTKFLPTITSLEGILYILHV